MSTVQQSTFIINFEDRAQEAKTVVSEGLRIGRRLDCDIWLNHPTVSRLHAGINEIEGYFYIVNLSGSSAVTLNGRIIPFNEVEALTEGDEIQIGPYFLHIENLDAANKTLRISIVQQYALHVGEREPRHKVERLKTQPAVEDRVADSGVASSLRVFWDKRTREKAGRLSPLHPQTPPRLGKARFNWTPTRDLIRPWPLAIFVWALIVVGALSAVAAFKYKNAFAPQPISAPHTRQNFTLMPAIAKQPNGSSCTSCHAVGVSMANSEKMNANCAICHQTEAFAATITRAHIEAGITCTSCHTEHRGENFSPMAGGLGSCAKCHNDKNNKIYNGKSVHTPHSGTYGYPVTNGVWTWKGLDAEELAAKPEITALLKQNRTTLSQTQQWRSVQFHGIHLYRVPVVAGIEGIDSVDGTGKVLSCSSCHKTGFAGANIDRTFPRTTCSKCHNVQVFNETSRAPMGAEAPSCTSCHVQHIKDTHWATSLLDKKTDHTKEGTTHPLPVLTIVDAAKPRATSMGSKQ
ncbi:MAG: FHA domain-containing protein [Acidobacteriota bacterium]|nr:FHA domain-containing protein [Acidobacteriota bacterium]